MEIKSIPISKINPAPYNPRADLQPGDPEYEKLKRSMESFGYVEPLVWNERTETLVSGHQRLKILKEQSVKTVQVSVVDLPVEKEKALNVALNKIEGRWNDDLLLNLLQELEAVPDFDVALTGFDPPEISSLMDACADTPEDDFDFEAELGKIKKPVTRKGDLIELGEHRIFCGDSSSQDDLKRLVGTKTIDLVHTDPPYNVDYYGGNRPKNSARPKVSRQWARIYSDNMSQADYEVWLTKILQNMSGVLSKGAVVYIWNGHRQFGPMHRMLESIGFRVSCVITWAKPNFAISFADYNQQTEFCLYGWKAENGKHNWYGPTNESTLWEINRDPTKEYIHPTQKPVALAARAIKNSSKRNDRVLDLFLGSGPTLIAAESLGRRCYGIELDPKYIDAIVRRYIAFAGADKVSKDVLKRYWEER
ncbi:MAG: DNA modification methylase [Candidatus Omnitrophica bacterium]|nr:DNA modification methylase [Candidatus Omnitrophota bacterium]